MRSALERKWKESGLQSSLSFKKIRNDPVNAEATKHSIKMSYKYSEKTKSDQPLKTSTMVACSFTKYKPLSLTVADFHQQKDHSSCREN